MPAAHPTINLLGQDTSANSPWNRIMDWISTYGRYIMITTELIVLIAFASRFSLDRKLTDLKEDAMQSMASIATDIATEANIESLVCAKGFEKCVAVINENSASVVVKSGGLLPNEVIQIKEIVCEQSNIDPANVKIIEIE